MTLKLRLLSLVGHLVLKGVDPAAALAAVLHLLSTPAALAQYRQLLTRISDAELPPEIAAQVDQLISELIPATPG